MADRGGYKDLIIRWVKSQLQWHGDPVKARRDRQEAADIQQTPHDRVQDDAGRVVFDTLMPDSVKRRLTEREELTEVRKVEATREQREKHKALPRGLTQITLAGAVCAQVNEQLPLKVTRLSEMGEALTIDFTPLDPIPVGHRKFHGLQFAIPVFHGAGHYDLSMLYEKIDANQDPYWYQLWLESDDEPFYWVTDSGPGTVEVLAIERSIYAHLPMQNAGSEYLTVDLAVTLPSA